MKLPTSNTTLPFFIRIGCGTVDFGKSRSNSGERWIAAYRDRLNVPMSLSPTVAEDWSELLRLLLARAKRDNSWMSAFDISYFARTNHRNAGMPNSCRRRRTCSPMVRSTEFALGSRKTRRNKGVGRKGTYPTPSKADIAMTREIVAAAKALGLAVHDHLVIGRGGHASFKSLGLLS
jgi:hypothetical protein